MSHKAVSKFVRVATEGPTVDGREITAKQIQEMADNYDPQKYGARIWVEHFRGLLVESSFPALGDVVALKAEKSEDGKLALYAQIAPNEKLLEANRLDQKVYSSIELDPNFAGSGEAYMVGLAITDTPASLGTDRLKFSADHLANTGKKTQIMPAVESGVLDLTSEDDNPAVEPGPSLAERIGDIFSNTSGKTNKRLDDLEAGMVTLAQGIDGMAASITASVSKLNTAAAKPAVSSGTAAAPEDEVAALKAQVAELSARLETEPDPSNPERPASTGADTFSKTDC